MALHPRLLKIWQCSSRGACRTLEIDEKGIALGKTLLAGFSSGGLSMNDEAVSAMLSVAYGGTVSSKVFKAFESAVRCWKSGDKALANMHLALTGLPEIDVEQAHRLFAADWALARGVTLMQLRKLAGLQDDDDSDDEDDDNDNDNNDSGFDDAHPRWSAGSPGGIGGEFRPKDSGDAVTPDRQSFVPDNGRVDESYGLDALIGLGVAIIGAAAGLETVGADEASYTTEAITETAPTLVTEPTFPKPEGIPDDWIEKPSGDGKGIQWVNPDNPNDRVRLMPGNPNAKFPSQATPYVIDQSGGFRDVNGDSIPGAKPGDTPEAHIPANEFKFRR